MVWPVYIAALSDLISFLTGLFCCVLPVALIVVLWKRFGMKPTSRTIYAGVGWIIVGVLASIFPNLEKMWWGYLAVWSLLLLLDGVALICMKAPTVKRVLPKRFAINVESDVILTVKNPSNLSMSAIVYDGLTEVSESAELPWRGRIPAGKYAEIHYPLKFSERGEAVLKAAHVHYEGLLRLWSRQVRVGEEESTKVYPNYEPVIQFALLAMENSPEQMGIVMKNRVGMSKDFHQLREYQYGDTLSRVDWKATSKKLHLISRDYQEQRNQNLILVVDCGQRMRAMDGEMPQFDHCLNAMLLLAYVALKQGDNVGVMSFGGQERWLPPVSGVNSMTTILNHLYDYQTAPVPSDYAEAAEKLLVRQKRRSLVVFLSNIRGEDGEDLIEPLRLVRRKHVTILANLREKDVAERMLTPVESLDDALALGATQRYLDERSAVLKELSSHGIVSVDEIAENLPVALANKYLLAREGV